MSVYLRAAESVDRGDNEYSCVAIDMFANGFAMMITPQRRAYTALFKPGEHSTDYDWKDWWCGDPTPKYQQRRVLALLFMHWMTVNP